MHSMEDTDAAIAEAADDMAADMADIAADGLGQESLERA